MILRINFVSTLFRSSLSMIHLLITLWVLGFIAQAYSAVTADTDNGAIVP